MPIIMMMLQACRPAAPPVEPAPSVEPAPAAAAPGEAPTPVTVDPYAPRIATPGPWTDALLPWTSARASSTQAYLLAHRTAPLSGDVTADTRMVPRAIVLHWTAGPTAQSARATFTPDLLEGRTELAGAGAVNVGAHFLVDRDGHIERLFPETTVVRHCIGLNHVAIGVENVGGGETWPLTEAQVAANVALIRHLTAAWPIEVLLGHHEYIHMEGSPLFEERDPNYRTQKPDPGPAFMEKVRAGVADLGLAAPPAH